MTLGQIRACTGEEPLNLGDPSLQCHSPLGKAGGLAGSHGAGSGGPAGFGVNLWWACWLGLNLTEGASGGVVGDSCLNRYQLALTALCGTHPPSFPTGLFQAEEHVDCGFGGDVSDLHFERCSSSSLSAL